MHQVQIRSLLVAMALSPIAATAAAADASGATPATPIKEASIPFANRGGINNWGVVAGDDTALYVQGSNRQWYKATFFSRCSGLSLAHSIHFKTSPGGSFDKFSSISIGRHQRCHLTSLVAIPAPDKNPKSHKMPAAPAAAPPPAPAAPPAPAGASPTPQ